MSQEVNVYSTSQVHSIILEKLSLSLKADERDFAMIAFLNLHSTK